MNPQPATQRNVKSLLAQAIHPLSDRVALDGALQQLNPLWSTGSIRARILRRHEESPDTFSLLLKTNRHWPGHRAGQHVRLSVEMNGVIRQRTFSLSSATGQAGMGTRRVRLTIQRQGDDGATAWLHAHAKPGMVVELSRPDGQFVLPSPAPDQLLMIAGGSGITPLIAMLQQLALNQYQGDIRFVQLCRQEAHRLFPDELTELGQQLPGLSVLVHASASKGRLPMQQLTTLIPDLAERYTLVCGPTSLMSDVSDLWQSLAEPPPLLMERFTAPRPAETSDGAFQVRLANSEQAFTQLQGNNLLESAEAAGLQPAYGCRAGLCRTCLCRKHHGAVRNLLTGQRSSQPDEWIQLCVSVAESDLELTL